MSAEESAEVVTRGDFEQRLSDEIGVLREHVDAYFEKVEESLDGAQATAGAMQKDVAVIKATSEAVAKTTGRAVSIILPIVLLLLTTAIGMGGWAMVKAINADTRSIGNERVIELLKGRHE